MSKLGAKPRKGNTRAREGQIQSENSFALGKEKYGESCGPESIQAWAKAKRVKLWPGGLELKSRTILLERGRGR